MSPVRRQGGIDTGVALHNPGEEVVTLELTLTTRNGQQIPEGFQEEQVPARGHRALFVSRLFPDADTEDFVGVLVAEVSGGVVAATVIELGAQPGQFTTLPVVPLLE